MMKTTKTFLVLILTYILTIGSSPGLQAKSLIPQEDERNRAIEFFHEGKFDQALPVFQKLANAYPADYLLKYFTGASLVETGNTGKEAEMYLLLAITREVPAKVFYYLGRLYHTQENWDGALRFYNRFTNNADSKQLEELRIKELSELAYNNINPFRGSEIVFPQQTVIQEPPSPVSEPEVTRSENIPQSVFTDKEETTTLNIQEQDSLQATTVLQAPIPEAVESIIPEMPVATENTSLETTTQTIIEDTDSLINARELTTQNPTQVTETNNVPPSAKVDLPNIEFIQFRINPRVNYLTEDMFKINEAREAWKLGLEKEKLLNEKLLALQQQRQKYGTAPSQSERDRLADGIIQLEKETLTLHAESDMLYGKARQLEQDWWTNATMQEYENLRLTTDSLQKLEEAIRIAALAPAPVIDQQLLEEAAGLPEEDETTTEEETSHDTVIYKVQLGSFTRAVPPRTKELFDKIGMIRTIETFVDENKATVYTTGNMKTFADGLALQNQVRLEGVKDAFVIAILNEKRISLQEAKKITGEE